MTSVTTATTLDDKTHCTERSLFRHSTAHYHSKALLSRAIIEGQCYGAMGTGMLLHRLTRYIPRYTHDTLQGEYCKWSEGAYTKGKTHQYEKQRGALGALCIPILPQVALESASSARTAGQFGLHASVPCRHGQPAYCAVPAGAKLSSDRHRGSIQHGGRDHDALSMLHARGAGEHGVCSSCYCGARWPAVSWFGSNHW